MSWVSFHLPRKLPGTGIFAFWMARLLAIELERKELIELLKVQLGRHFWRSGWLATLERELLHRPVQFLKFFLIQKMKLENNYLQSSLQGFLSSITILSNVVVISNAYRRVNYSTSKGIALETRNLLIDRFIPRSRSFEVTLQARNNFQDAQRIKAWQRFWELRHSLQLYRQESGKFHTIMNLYQYWFSDLLGYQLNSSCSFIPTVRLHNNTFIYLCTLIID